MDAGTKPSAEEIKTWTTMAEEALAGGQTGSLLLLGELANLQSGPGAEAAAKSALEYARRASTECRLRADRENATRLLLLLLSQAETSGYIERDERVRVTFIAGGLWLSLPQEAGEPSSREKAIEYWEKAHQADPKIAEDMVKSQAKLAEETGNAELAKALQDWWATKE